MSLAAGTLNQRISIQQRGATCDAAGQPVESWSPVAEVWASIMHASGMSTIKAGADTSVVKASIRIRYRTGLNAGMRVVGPLATYAIKAVLPDVARKEYVDLVCEVINGVS